MAALAGAGSPSLRAQELPAWLPRYDLDIRLDTQDRLVQVKQRVTWVNRHERPAADLVFNVHGRYEIPDGDIGLLAKMVEILRVAPKEALPFDGPALRMQTVRINSASLSPLGRGAGGEGLPVSRRNGPSVSALTSPLQRRSPSPPTPLPKGGTSNSASLPAPNGATGESDFQHPADNPTSMVVPLPRPVAKGESVTIDLEYTFKVPAKKGRWSQWNDITALAQWLPVLAVYDERGWRPAPFIPWHQPFHQEAGIYSARIELPSDQKLACSAAVIEATRLGNGWTEYVTAPTPLRDFAIVCSARFQEHTAKVGNVVVRCLHLPQHSFYAKEMVETVCAALPVYEKWFGPYPYPQFTIAEACFGWNGNECGGLVLIDDRMFNMPTLAKGYPNYLIAHELCHQWWYNVVGTDGYAETFMDESLATHFSHRFANLHLGKNNAILDYPRGLGWLPNIHRDDLRNTGMIGARARGEIHPTVQDLPEYKHMVNLMATAYDRGSKVIGLIEERLGAAAFEDFMRQVYRKYQFKILYVADFQRELETYTGRSWDDFFTHWVRGSGVCDWAVDNVEIDGASARSALPFARLKQPRANGRVKVTVQLKQRGGFNEPTVLGVRLGKDDGQLLRVPIYPDAPTLQIDSPPTTIVSQVVAGARPGADEATVRVEMELPSVPSQIVVDPDRVLVEDNLSNNRWRAEAKFRLTPLYTQLDEVEVVNAYDRWNFVAGPWIYFSSYDDPWYHRSSILGLRVGAMRLQEYRGGAFVGLRADDRNIVAGADGLWDHFPHPKTQVGFSLEQSLYTLGPDRVDCSRAAIFGRYVLMYSSSLFLPPFEYVEMFSVVQNRCLPEPRHGVPGDKLFDERLGIGVHYHKNLLTPYWDPEGGIAFDVTYQYGLPVFNDGDFHQVYGQVSFVKSIPKLITDLSDGPVMSWLKESRFAFRLGGAVGLPEEGTFFTLGGGDRFRGFDLRERQGSATWVGSIEWRLPIAQNVCWDLCDHVATVRNVYLTPFYDIGDAYVNDQSLGPVAHAFGVGLRVDVTWLGLIERTMLRVDVAKTVNQATPWQVWFGIQHPF